jgi:hypothetical protein
MSRRVIKPRLCPRCQKLILTGPDNDIGAFTVNADPTPVDEIGEILALAAGRATFDLAGNRERRYLYRRDQWAPGLPRRYPVLPEHRCGKPLPQQNISFPEHNSARQPLPENPSF